MEIKAFFFPVVALLLLGSTTCAATANCKEWTFDFIIKDDDPEVAAVEDDIVKDLAKIGIKVNTRKLNASAYIEAELNGDYNMMFTRTWGAPYDPHSYLNSWAVPSHVEYSAIGKLQSPLTRDILLQMIKDVQLLTDQSKIAKGWEGVLQEIHKEAIFLPLWGTRTPYVLNRRFGGFSPSEQSAEYPLASVKIFRGSSNVTIAPGTGGTLFKTVGPVHPHLYSPNQLFAQAWVYETLVGYGQDGEITPVLAETWKVENLSPQGSRYTFTLRQGVKFHDGSEWNCSVAKLNFDHVLSPTVKQRHQWYGATSQLTSWKCSEGKFVLETKDNYYPLLQELTYIRPLTFAAASAFSQGLDSHPEQHNSCNPGEFGAKWAHLEKTVTCAGLKPIGTGPFKVVDAKQGVFARHDEYWGQKPEIQFLHIKTYKNTDDVMTDLLSGNLDMALGVGPLKATQVQKIKFENSDIVDVRHSDVTQHALMIMNGNKKGTDDVKVRQAIIHAIDKARFIEGEFAGLEQPVTQLLPYSAPFCNVDLSPKWAYDFDKAVLLNCPNYGGLPGWAIAIIVIASVLFVGLLAFTFLMYYRERQGKPVFTRLDAFEPEESVANPEMSHSTAETGFAKDDTGQHMMSSSKPVPMGAPTGRDYP